MIKINEYALIFTPPKFLYNKAISVAGNNVNRKLLFAPKNHSFVIPYASFTRWKKPSGKNSTVAKFRYTTISKVNNNDSIKSCIFSENISIIATKPVNIKS